MGEPRAIMAAHRIDEYLRLILHAAKSLAMYDPIAIAHIFRAHRALLNGPLAPTCVFAKHRIFGEGFPLSLIKNFPHILHTYKDLTKLAKILLSLGLYAKRSAINGGEASLRYEGFPFLIGEHNFLKQRKKGRRKVAPANVPIVTLRNRQPGSPG